MKRQQASDITRQEEHALGPIEEDDVASECSKTESAADQEEALKDFLHSLSSTIQDEKPSFIKKNETCLKGQILARGLYHHEKFRSREVVWKLRDDVKLAEETVKAYITFFKFESMPIDEALRLFLRVFWPEDELELQHLLINHFTQQYIACNKLQLDFQPEIYNVTWAMIMLNADLHAGHKGKKMSCSEFILILIRACRDGYEYDPIQLIGIYDSIEMKTLEVFRVKTRFQDAFENNNSHTTKVHKTGHLICKQVMDENGRKTRKGRRSWKPFTAVLKDMALQLQQYSKVEKKITIRLHHTIAYPLKYKNIPHVLCIKTADSRVFYFQAENEEEQSSWVAAINQIAARYSAPPLTFAHNDIKEHRPQVLPAFPSHLSLEQQLQYTESQLQKVSNYLTNCMSMPNRKSTLPVDYMEQEVTRYTTYVRALQKLVKEKDPESE
ncbi:PH and SEC7 domain-containing protein 1 isoform X4 [Silurus meridionalis]|nr:PH and SEC7 domain-containing protein 1 isoform X4 [Silurus meridionalis]